VGHLDRGGGGGERRVSRRITTEDTEERPSEQAILEVKLVQLRGETLECFTEGCEGCGEVFEAEDRQRREEVPPVAECLSGLI